MCDLLTHFQFTDQWNIGVTPSELATNVEIEISGTYVNYDSPRLPIVHDSDPEWVQWTMVNQDLEGEEV